MARNPKLHGKINPQDLKRMNEGYLLSQEEEDNLRSFLKANPNFRGKLKKQSDKNSDPRFQHDIVIMNHPEKPGERFVVANYKALGKGAFGKVFLGQDVTLPESKEWTALKRQKPSPDHPRYPQIVRAISGENQTLKDLGELLGEAARSKKILNQAGSEEEITIYESAMRLGHGKNIMDTVFDETGTKIPGYQIFLLEQTHAEVQQNMLKLLVIAREFMREERYMHESGYINRDIKLPNMLFDEENGRGKIVDQGFTVKASELKKLQEEFATLGQELAEMNEVLDAFALEQGETSEQAQTATQMKTQAQAQTTEQLGTAEQEKTLEQAQSVEPGQTLEQEPTSREEQTSEQEQTIEQEETAEISYYTYLENLKLKENPSDKEKEVIKNYERASERWYELGPFLMKGTPPYMAPETLRNHDNSMASDVYATGVSLSQLFAEFEINGNEYDPDNPVSNIIIEGKDHVLKDYQKDWINREDFYEPLQPWQELFKNIVRMTKAEPEKRPELRESMDLFAKSHIALLHEMGLHTQAKFVEHEVKIQNVQYALLQQLELTSDPAKRSEFKAKLQDLEELRAQVHTITYHNPIKTEDLALLADAIIEMRLREEANPVLIAKNTELKEILLDLQDDLVPLLASNNLKRLEKRKLESPSQNIQQEIGMQEPEIAARKSPMFELWRKREKAETKVTPEPEHQALQFSRPASKRDMPKPK